MSSRKAVLWFRTDLRLHDNEALRDALEVAKEVYPIYVFDSRLFLGYSSFGLRKMGRHRCKFLIESVMNLRENLRSLGSDLIIRIGEPEKHVAQLASEVKSSWVFCMRERTKDEIRVQDALEQNLWSIGQELRFSRGKMLYYTQDLPFPITHAPDHFNAFKKEVEKIIPVREPLDSPEEMPAVERVEVGDLPEIQYFGWDVDHPNHFDHFGGETHAMKRLESLSDSECFQNYGHSYHFLSAYLSAGCLSPKTLYWAVHKYANSRYSKQWRSLLQDLLARDYFRLMSKKHGSLVFEKGGIRGSGDEHLKDDRKSFLKWVNSDTGDQYIDAYMDQLYSTGYISSTGRQSVACYLVNQLGVNWQLGAAYFESMLVDYDPCSNWGNWNALAGIGGDFKDFSRFNHVYQTKKEDPDLHFISPWLSKEHDIGKGTAELFE